jgi:hypothetical protein
MRRRKNPLIMKYEYLARPGTSENQQDSITLQNSTNFR